MEINDLQGKLVAVLGYGLEGKAVAGYLLKHGVKPVLFDQRPWENWNEIEKLEIKKLGLNFIFGPDCFMELKGFDVAFRSPGVNLKQLTINNLQLTSQTKWFFEHCSAKIIGVTGTKGKGTTCSLIYQMLLTDKKPTFLTGNIGKIQPLEILDDLKTDDWVVYELSSFQLQDLGKSPHIGVVLMVTKEHLDYHRDEAEYVQAKAAICKFQTAADFTVANQDFVHSADIGKFGNGKKLWFSCDTKFADCYVSAGQVYLKNQPLLNTNQLQLRGSHNLQNVCAAVLAASAAGCDSSAIKSAAQDFRGLEHRLEFVAEKQGIKFYNDSFSTTPETAIAAITSFVEPEILILGGSSKNSDFTELGKAVVAAKNIKTLILVGEEAVRIKKSIVDAGIFKNEILEGAKNMEEMFAQIKSVAKTGDAVLLSPACASFGMFKNYKDRGEQFKDFSKNY